MLRMACLMFVSVVCVILFIGCGEDNTPVIQGEEGTGGLPIMTGKEGLPQELPKEEGETPQEEENRSGPIVDFVTIAEGQEVPPNKTIMATFAGHEMKWVEITVSDVKGTTSLRSGIAIAIFVASESMSIGVHTLTITGEDMNGKKLNFTPINFKVPEPGPLPEVKSVNVGHFQEIPYDTVITVTCNVWMKSVEIKVSDSTGISSFDRYSNTLDTATWQPIVNPAGWHTLTVTGVDVYDRPLKEFTLRFKALAPNPDKWWPANTPR